MRRSASGSPLIARTSPASWGITAFSTWSLSKLRDHLLERGTVAAISRETLRRILHAGSMSWQTTSTWKASTDSDFLTKMHRILDLNDHPPADDRVICVDEFGPLNLMPRTGRAWRPAGSPRRLRATYNRRHGVMHMLAALDLATGKIHYRIRRRKRHGEYLGLLDRAAAPRLLRMLRATGTRLRHVWADGGYTGHPIDDARTLGLTMQIVQRLHTHSFTVLPRRWVVERTLAWITRHRRCARDYERHPTHHAAFVHWAMIRIHTRRLTQ